MQTKSLKLISVVLMTLAAASLLWLVMSPDKTVAVRPQVSLQSCNGDIGRFQLVPGADKSLYLMDTCVGDVWALVPLLDKTEPGAWVIMDRYDTREEVARLMEYLRTQGRPQPTMSDQPAAEPGGQTYPDTGQVPNQAYPSVDDQTYSDDQTQGQATDQEYPPTVAPYAEPAEPQPNTGSYYPNTDPQY